MISAPSSGVCTWAGDLTSPSSPTTTYRHLAVVFEAGRAVPGVVGQRDPELQAVHARRVVRRCVLGVGDAPSGRHQVELTGLDQLVTADAVAVLDHALDQPGDRL
jgi:hypothetical protein